MNTSVRIHCIHTSVVHERTFARLFAATVPTVTLVQSVRTDWLAHARAHGLDGTLSDDVSKTLAAAAASADAVLLTCSTLGPLADIAPSRRVVRIDTPLMCRAAQHDGPALLAMCLDSTRATTVALFERACVDAAKPPVHRTVFCDAAWPWFEADNSERFAQAIAETVRKSIAADGPVSCIVLAQASMAVAEPLLADLGVPVYSSPRLAVAETLRVATQHRQETRACA